MKQTTLLSAVGSGSWVFISSPSTKRAGGVHLRMSAVLRTARVRGRGPGPTASGRRPCLSGQTCNCHPPTSGGSTRPHPNSGDSQLCTWLSFRPTEGTGQRAQGTVCQQEGNRAARHLWPKTAGTPATSAQGLPLSGSTHSRCFSRLTVIEKDSGRLLVVLVFLQGGTNGIEVH